MYDIVKSLTVAVIIYRYPLFKCTQTRYGINSGRQSRSWPRRSLIVNMHDTGSWSHARRKLFSLSPVQYFTQCVISHYRRTEFGNNRTKTGVLRGHILCKTQKIQLNVSACVETSIFPYNWTRCCKFDRLSLLQIWLRSDKHSERQRIQNIKICGKK